MKIVTIILPLIFCATVLSTKAQTLCPDGSYVGGGGCSMAPDGTFVDGEPQMAPDGSYVGGEPTMTPDGSYVGSDNENE